MLTSKNIFFPLESFRSTERAYMWIFYQNKRRNRPLGRSR